MRFSYEGNPQAALGYRGAALQELHRLQMRMDAAGLDQGSFQKPLADGSYCYGYILPGGITAVHVVAGEGVSEPVYRLIPEHVPDFLSGYAFDTWIDYEKGIPQMRGMQPTSKSTQLHPEELKSGARQPSPRLGTYLHEDMWSVLRMGTPQTQHTYLRPTMYSGKMQKVVQFLLGFGKQPFEDSIYDKAEPVLGEWTLDDETEPVFIRPPTRDEMETAANGLQVKYDYRWIRTHGITTSSQGTPWLVSIGYNGIYAMRLPINKNTTLEAFEDKLGTLNDTDAKLVLETFGGFPTGEAFPQTDVGFDAYVRAGRILTLRTKEQMAAFYDVYSAYSMAMGWSFSESGREAHNTGYRYHTDGRQRGAHYAISLSISDLDRDPPIYAGKLKARVLSVREGTQDEIDALMWKIDHMTDGVANGWLAAPVNNFFRDINNYVLPHKDGSGSAGMSRVSEDILYWPTRHGPQIKFPDPVLGFLVSHDMRPDRYIGGLLPHQDTTMHVFFVGERLYWCRFFCPKGQALEPKVTGDSQFDIDWNPSGNFQRETIYGPRGVPPMFYTSEFDDRRELGDHVTTETYRRVGNGRMRIYPGRPDMFGPSGQLNNMIGDITRLRDIAECGPGAGVGETNPLPENGDAEDSKKTISMAIGFTYESWWTFTAAPALASAIAVPLWQRNAYYYAMMDGHFSSQTNYSKTYGSVANPYIGHWSSSHTQPGVLVDEVCVPFAPNIMWMSGVYSGQPGSPYAAFMHLAGGGDWAPLGTLWMDALVDAGENPPDEFSITYHPTERTLKVWLAGPAGGTYFTHSETRTGYEASLWEPWWFRPSPDDFGFTAFIQATHNALGLSRVVLADRDMNTLLPRHVYNGSMPSDITSPIFFGVFNGS